MTAVNIYCCHYLRHCPPSNNCYVHKRPHRILPLRLAVVVAVIVLLFGLSFPLVTVIGMIPSAFFYSSRHQQRIALPPNVAFVGWNHRQQQQPTIRHLRRYLHVSSSSNRIRNSVSSSALSSQMTPFPGISNNNNNTNTLDNGRYGNNNTNGIGMSSSELAERRLRYYQATKEEKIQSLHNIQKRNLHIKKQLSNHDNNTAAMQLIAVKVNVCPELRHELKLSGREKRGRLFVEPDSNPTKSLRALKRELHGFFRSLKKDTFQLYASLQIVPDGGGNDVQQQQIDNGTNTNDNNFPQDSIVKGEEVRWPIETDDDVVATFQRALQFFDAQIQRQRPPTTNESSDRNLDINENVLKRPSIMLYVQRDPNAPIVTPPPQPYLENMPNPDESTTITMLSFYSFGNIQNPEEFAMQLRKLWKPFQVQGRVYVATEGMNAQMSVPTNVLSQFIECCDYYLPDPGVSYYLRTYGNSVNIDPIPLTRVEYESAGTPSAGGKPAPPFTNLHIRVRQQIVTDGLEKPYNWLDSGMYQLVLDTRSLENSLLIFRHMKFVVFKKIIRTSTRTICFACIRSLI